MGETPLQLILLKLQTKSNPDQEMLLQTKAIYVHFKKISNGPQTFCYVLNNQVNVTMHVSKLSSIVQYSKCKAVCQRHLLNSHSSIKTTHLFIVLNHTNNTMRAYKYSRQCNISWRSAFCCDVTINHVMTRIICFSYIKLEPSRRWMAESKKISHS